MQAENHYTFSAKSIKWSVEAALHESNTSKSMPLRIEPNTAILSASSVSQRA